MTYRFFNIRWDTDGMCPEVLSLPRETALEIQDPALRPEQDGADILSDKYGYCVFGFEFERIEYACIGIKENSQT
jgi:hypothetical protein